MSTATEHPIPSQRTNPAAESADGSIPLPREALRQIVIDVLATAVIDLLLAEHEHHESEVNDATR
ncbi:MAG: hypothetical protein A2496_23945 [Burkholderiales bacterium RIFOXYC12_FULL_60_6]|nr:MAG: hypothetical protein A2496_23945 [Burkholderiales bacterium RIFOXYC12_FULL_60_6]